MGEVNFFSQVDLFISAECDIIKKVRRVDLPIDFILGGYILLSVGWYQG